MSKEQQIQRIIDNAKYCGLPSSEATRQILLIVDNVQSEPSANFCICKKPWGVGGRCVACGMPIEME